MTDRELTGEEKYLMCMGYLQHVVDLSILSGKPLSPRVLSEVSTRIETKFTTHDLKYTSELLAKIGRFSCTEIMQDVINEIENEEPILDDTN